MREILFRGKRLDNGEWIEGFYWKDIWGDGESCYILYDGEDYQIDPATVGQYTGLTDKNGVKIFDGDILKWDEREWGEPHFEVAEWDYDLLAMRAKDFEEFCVVCGNIHDNLELLEGGVT